jgi:uncharacterized protein YndB with AHSA1/START domain
MTTRTVTHGNFTIERTYPASPARVFAAFATPEAKARWFGGPDELLIGDRQFDFRIGGHERMAVKGETTYVFDAVYYDIVPEERIITSYEMYANDDRISVSVATVELTPAGSGTHLVYTEQGAFLDGLDKPEWREHGTTELLDKLGAVLRADAQRN